MEDRPNRKYTYSISVQFEVPESYFDTYDEDEEKEFCCIEDSKHNGDCESTCDHYFQDRLLRYLTPRKPVTCAKEREENELDWKSEWISSSIIREDV